MSSADIVSTLRKFDAYPKTLDDFRIKTFGGATAEKAVDICRQHTNEKILKPVTILSGIIMTLLFVSELQAYLSPDVSEELFVDTSRGTKLRINLDIIIPSISCEFLVLDAMDTSGEQHLHIEHNIYKRRLDKSGNPVEEPRKEDLGATITGAQDTNTTKETCGSCYGAGGPNECCNTCEAVKQAYRRKQWAIDKLQDVKQCQVENYSDKLKTAFTEACQIYGYMEVNRVGGSFHIAPGQSFSINHVHVHDVQPFSSSNFNTSHRITHLSFGKNIPGKTNPIDGTEVVTHEGSTMFQYYVKIVPTTYVSKDNTILLTNQFSVTRHQKVISTISGESGMPGIFFNYELAPMMVKYTERERSFGHFATNVCAIIGGVFTVAGLIDSLLYHSYKAIQKKIELGKVN